MPIAAKMPTAAMKRRIPKTSWPVVSNRAIVVIFVATFVQWHFSDQSMYRMVYNTENRYDEELERKKAWMNRGNVKLPPYVLEGFESDGFFVLHEAFNAYDVRHLERQVAMNVFGRQCSGRLGQLLSGRFCPDSLWVDDVYLKTFWERSYGLSNSDLERILSNSNLFENVFPCF